MHLLCSHMHGSDVLGATQQFTTEHARDQGKYLRFRNMVAKSKRVAQCYLEIVLHAQCMKLGLRRLCGQVRPGTPETARLQAGGVRKCNVIRS